MLELEYLYKILHYDPETGIFTWLVGRKGHNVGNIAGTVIKNGYILIMIDGIKYYAHRLAWFYVTKKWPKDQIDHINTVRNDNRWFNLREANGSQNHGNMRLSKANTSGIKGVHWYKRKFKWHVQIMINGTKHHIGYFDNIEDAAKAYEEAAIKHFKEFARPARKNDGGYSRVDLQ